MKSVENGIFGSIIFDFLKRVFCSSISLYILFGVCTTLINFVVFFCFYTGLGWVAWISNVLAYIPSMLFAWATNRTWCFPTTWHMPLKPLLLEFAAFIGSRLGTGLFDIFLVYLTIDVLQFDALLMKILIGVLIVVLNYLISKWVIFRKVVKR